MTSREYLEALGEALSTLVPDRERSETLRYYEEYFEEAGPEREAELMEELGSPEDLARKIAREGGFSGGPEEPAPKRHLNRWEVGGGHHRGGGAGAGGDLCRPVDVQYPAFGPGQ